MHRHSYPRSQSSMWLAFTLSVWLDAVIRFHSVMAFSNIEVSRSARCQTTTFSSSAATVGRNSLQSSSQIITDRIQLYMSTTDGQSTTTEEQLQNRFQEAMQRRKQRRAPSQEVEHDVSSENSSAELNIHEIEEISTGMSKSGMDVDEISDTKDPIENEMVVTTEADTSSEPIDTSKKNLVKPIMREDEREGPHQRRVRTDASDNNSNDGDAKRTP